MGLKEFMLRLESGGTDFKCIQCIGSFDVMWSEYNEYGTPESGSYDVICPSCGLMLMITVGITVTYEAKLKSNCIQRKNSE